MFLVSSMQPSKLRTSIYPMSKNSSGTADLSSKKNHSKFFFSPYPGKKCYVRIFLSLQKDVPSSPTVLALYLWVADKQ